ncbi:MAG TPA: hypothetical protein VNO50_07785 [Pyrinomonadaceae bacterium]|nr:hypothetical protein [Pyrinomonadaceae bacterium]
MKTALRTAFLVILSAFLVHFLPPSSSAQPEPAQAKTYSEYLWYEAENMRGFGTKPTGEPIQNPSWLGLPRIKAPGWGINGPGVSAEWSQGGESEWNSAAASLDESRAAIHQDVEIPRGGDYRIWIRYADWANKTETFTVKIFQGDRAVFRQEFGHKAIVDAHDEVSMYWGWSFTWDGAPATLVKGPARISIEIEKPAEAVRQVDCALLTNDLAFVPEGRRKPDFAAARYLREWSASRVPLASLINQPPGTAIPSAWKQRQIAGRDFLMPWNITTEFWKEYDKPVAERSLYPFHAEPIEEFVKKYKGAREVPIFGSKLVAPVIYINNLREYLQDGSAFRRYLSETKSPFAILINYGSAELPEAEGQAAWKLLNGELKDQFLGWISGESVGYVWEQAPLELRVNPEMSRRELLEAHRLFYDKTIARKWAAIFHTETGAMWDKLIPAQSTSSTSFAHALTDWGVKLLGVETAAVQPMLAMRVAFTRGAARQQGVNFLYYHAPNFGDSATTFTKVQNFAGPDHFFHSRYGATMGPSLSWYRKNYYFYYMSGAAAIYLEQGGDQFFKPGPNEHEFQLNPLGKITEEFMRFAEKHPNRGVPYTPIAFLLDPAHGWDMTDYPQWPFQVSQINRSDLALRELFGAAYYPGLVKEGEPASADRQVFVNGIFGDIFDVLVASDSSGAKSNVQSPTSKAQSPRSVSQSRVKAPSGEVAPATSALRANKPNASKREEWDYEGSDAIQSGVANQTPNTQVEPQHGTTTHASRVRNSVELNPYRAIVVGGHINWSTEWIRKLTAYVSAGGTVVLNSAQIKGLPAELTGLRLTGATGEAHNAKCLSPGEAAQDLKGQIFRYEKVELKGAQPLVTTLSNEPLVTVNKLGKGSVVLSTVNDLLGEDDRLTPFSAHMLAHVFADATPIKVTGNVEYLINQTDTGWIITLFNNEGVFKPQQGLAQVDRTAVVRADISWGGTGIARAQEWISDTTVKIEKQAGKPDSVSVNIAPGSVAIIELK